MDFDFKAIVTALIFFGGIKAIQAAVEWCKTIGKIPNWGLAVLPVFFGLLINVGGIAALGYFQEFGTIAIIASIIMGFVSGFAAMGLYDDRVSLTK